MRALLVVAVVGCVACMLGRTLVNLVLGRGGPRIDVLRSSEKLLLSCAIGLGLIAYGVFCLGMAGLLTPAFLSALLAVGTLAGIPGLRAICRDLKPCIGPSLGHHSDNLSGIGRLLAVTLRCVLVLLLVVAVIACFQPPGAHAWDALAYHLADPKVFLSNHRILLLPTEHHSNFPFTMEMLFMLGLAFDGYAAANLFHLLTGVLLVLAVFSFCDRFLSTLAGLVGAVVFATTPLVLWEATVAYIDLGLALYVFLSTYLLMVATAASAWPSIKSDLRSTAAGQSKIVLLAGVSIGFALGIKYLALVPFVLLLLLALWRRVPMRQLVLFGMAACIVGCPWYIKNAVWMHNPVYPFAFGVFPGSRYWSASRAKPYSEEQESFGAPHTITRPAEAARNLAVTPWELVSAPEAYTNRADFTFTSLIGGLYAGSALSALFLRRSPPAVRGMLAIFAAMVLFWFFVSQHIRYLIPALPFGAVVCGYVFERWLAAAATATGQGNVRTRIVNRAGGFITLFAFVGQAAVTGWGIFALPVAGNAAAQVQSAGLEPTALSVPEALTDLLNTQARERHLRRLNSYAAVQWINQHTSPGAGVVLYEDVFGFYLDRPYLWGNGEHSSYIPYNSLHTGQGLTEWLRGHGIEYALVNLNYSPGNARTLLPDDPEAVGDIMRQWYRPTDPGWRGIVGGAIQAKQWTVLYAYHGVAVLSVGMPPK
jgi:hypothetical protein